MSSQGAEGHGSALARAAEAHALVQTRPREALALATEALEAAVAEKDARAQVAALHARAWASLVLGDVEATGASLKAGIRIAERTGNREGAAGLRRLRAGWLADAGKTAAARREIETAVRLVTGLERARAQVHRLGINITAPTGDPAVHRRLTSDAARALRTLRRNGDSIWEARLLFNRGILHLDRGEFEPAERDLRHALELYEATGAGAAAANTAVALAELQLARGDVVSCLRTLDALGEVSEGELAYTERRGALAECRMRALTAARLLPEARAAGETWVGMSSRAARGDQVAEGTMCLAEIALLAGDYAQARSLSTRVARSFGARGVPGRAALARVLGLRARLLEGRATRASVKAAVESADALEQIGFHRDALRTRVLAARLALASGGAMVAKEQLAIARPLASRGTISDRIELMHARALLKGDLRLFAQGVALLEDYRAALGAIELRAAASGIGNELARDGLRLALASGDAELVLEWAERSRANALRLPAVRPTADAKMRTLQAELRRAGSLRRQTELETAIRERSRIVDGDGARGEQRETRLGERVLVEYVEVDGSLYAVTNMRGDLRLHALGANTVADELEWLRFALGRLAHGRLEPAQRKAVKANAGASATALDAVLGVETGDAPLVIVPTGALHAVPWGALPSLRGRAITVAPSLATWSRLAAMPRSRRKGSVFVAGPRLRHAAAEVRELGDLRPGPTVLHGRAATAAATLRALDGAAVAHLACHGHFRADSPLFSSLELADGPLNVYELQTLCRAPDLVVLSACDLATSDLHPGDEVLGLAAALLAMGTRTVIASVVPVPDAAVKRLMLAFHRNLLAGDAPAAALARAQSRAAVAGFVCLGSG